MYYIHILFSIRRQKIAKNQITEHINARRCGQCHRSKTILRSKAAKASVKTNFSCFVQEFKVVPLKSPSPQRAHKAPLTNFAIHTTIQIFVYIYMYNFYIYACVRAYVLIQSYGIFYMFGAHSSSSKLTPWAMLEQLNS